MLYIGHFSFDEIGSEQETRHGYFSCVVDTDSAESAVIAFKELIFSLKKNDDIFGRIVAVYLEDIIEFRNMPRKAVVTRIQSSAGEFPKSISRSLPKTVSPGINAYGWTPEVAEDEKKMDQDGYKEAKPFIKFES